MKEKAPPLLNHFSGPLLLREAPGAFPPGLLPPLCPGSPPPRSPVTSAWPNSVDLLRWPGASAGSSLLDAGRAWSHCRRSTLQCGGLSTVSLQYPTDSLLPVVLFSLSATWLVGSWSPQPGIKPGPSSVGAWGPNHWTPGNSLVLVFNNF